tara:strand:- start:304 stop:1125 length:822 start_codon:yes stop_codon:yes gene_type:complete
MNTKEPFLYEDIILENIYFTKIKKTKNKKIIYLKYKNGSKLDNLVIQTPTLWSIKDPVKIGENIYDLEIPLIGKRESHVNSFINFLNNLDEFIIKSAKNNATSWFNSSDEAVYLNSIRESNDCSIKNGFIKLKIIKSIDFKTVLKRDNKYKLKIENLKCNNWVKSIIQIFAIWIKPNNQFGIYFKPIIISFKEPIKQKINYDFIKETEEDDLIIDTAISINTEKKHDIFIKYNEVLSSQSNNLTSVLKVDINSFDNNSESDSSEDYLERFKSN